MSGVGVMGSCVHRLRVWLCAVLFACVVVLVGVAPPLAFAAAPVIVREQASATTSAVRFEAQVKPEGNAMTCVVQYVSEAQYTSSGWSDEAVVPCAEGVSAGVGQATVVAEASGLTLDTTYRYRFVASYGGSSLEGPEASVVTFGVKSFAVQAINEASQPFTQAGGHPYELDTSIAFNTNTVEFLNGGGNQIKASEMAHIKDVKVSLPPGLIGNPDATAKCSQYAVENFGCSRDAQVGTMELHLAEIEPDGENEHTVRPLFNVVPPAGVAARFSARFSKVANAFIDASVRTGSDYGVDADSLNITALAPVISVKVRLWGDPASPSHTHERPCKLEEGGGYESIGLPGFVGCVSTEQERPFITLPSACEGPLSASIAADSYSPPGVYDEDDSPLPAVTGCDGVEFTPSLHAEASTVATDSPTGLSVDVHVPQNEDPEDTSQSDLKDASVTLPPGLVVNPSSADGLEACSEAQAGFTGFTELNQTTEHGVLTSQFTPEPAKCPPGSKLGNVKIHTPLLSHPLEGGMYLATPHENPFHSLLALYLTVYDPISGVVVKLPGEVQACDVAGEQLEGATCEAPGQLTATFDQNPQLPFEDLEVDLFDSATRPSLTTPQTCGSYTLSSSLAPWDGNLAVTPSSNQLQITQAPGGGRCASSEGEAPNKPSFEAGTASPIAGSYSPFVLKLSREDGSQRFGALNVTLPPGLLGKVSGVEQCPQADIERAESRSHEGEGALEQSSPSCPSGSEVGVVHVGAGSGAPYYVTGKAYFAGPYEGAPFSLVIVTPALAGPFDLGTVVVRAGLYINPHTAQVTVRSDPFPTILDGIPLDIRSVGVEINRREFTLNPTSCEAMSVAGEEQSTAGQTASLSSRFKAEGCTNLPFHPSFTASTQGSTSKAGGASLTVKVNPLPGQANIAKVDLTLPKQLPARLTTLQKACTEAQFNANPAGCPEASDIGTAIAHTPILSSPLQGPAYLVSHGGAAFPDVEFVLQGENGVQIVLDGGTQIKNGITYSKFETVPDAPITSFETVLPEGPHSVLATDIPASAKYSLCAQKLQMPTTITGQNGVVVNQTTNIAVTGCKAVKTKPLTRAQKLAAALKKCRTKYKARKRRSKRVACEKAARKRFGPKKSSKEKGGKSKA